MTIVSDGVTDGITGVVSFVDVTFRFGVSFGRPRLGIVGDRGKLGISLWLGVSRIRTEGLFDQSSESTSVQAESAVANSFPEII